MAEIETKNTEVAVEETVTETGTEKSVDEQLRELNEQNQQLMTELAKLKKTSDKNASEAAQYKRQYRESLTAQERASQEKAEKEAAFQAEYEQLKKENAINRYMRQYLDLGFSPELADKAAHAKADGDEDVLLKALKEFNTASITAAKNEWLKSRPEINAGTQTTVTAEQFANMGIFERTELKRKSPEVYAELAHKS